MGNLCEHNPAGNRPRYPIILGEVDRHSGQLIRSSVTSIEDRQPGESEQLTLSNFYVREERGSGDLLLHMPRFFADDSAPGFSADLILQRIEIS